MPTSNCDHKEDFLDFLANTAWTVEPDADMTADGVQIDCTTFTITGRIYELRTLLDALGITVELGESCDDAINRHMEAGRGAPSDEQPDGNVETMLDGIKRLYPTSDHER